MMFIKTAQQRIYSALYKKIQRLRIMIQVMVLGVLAAQPVHALPKSFPQYPLITGGGTKVLPNVLLILDDSGSMSSVGLPENVVDWGVRKLWDEPRHRSYVNNTLYYDPAKTYRPWRTASMDTNARMPNADYKSVSYEHHRITDWKINLAGNDDSYFYLPKLIKRDREEFMLLPEAQRRDKNNYNKYRISPQGKIQRCLKSGNDCWWWEHDQWQDDIDYLKDYLEHPRSQEEEVQNFANFYQYHRTRMKVAKAGISEAFGRLDDQIRVGYNRLSSHGHVNYPIPINHDDAQFRGKNRTDFYKWVQDEYTPHGTWTKHALRMAGQYFETDDPYRTRKGGAPLSCRRNYALLVTDGEWTDGWVHINPGDQWCNTLACVAKHYWQRDLKPNLDDDVPMSGADNAHWQHMNTFGISIGMTGTLKAPADGPTERNKSLSTKWPKPDSPATKTDDLWHAAVEGRGNFFIATDADSFAKALTSTLTAVNNRQASSSTVSASSGQIKSDTLMFSASFKSGMWSGDLVARKVNALGLGFASKPEWVLSETFKSGGVNEHFKDRVIEQWAFYKKDKPVINIDRKISFDYKKINEYTFPPGMKDYAALYARSDTTDAVSAEDNIAWLRGDQSKERENGGTLRNRSHPIGDIVHSTVAYAEHGTFEREYSGQDMVYVGANDGMLHGIRARDGKVMYSYIPRGVEVSELAKLSSPQYEHRFFVDGDIEINTEYRRYTGHRNILMASLGRGGRGVVMLTEITYDNRHWSPKPVFDHTLPPSNTTDDKNMGYVLGQIRIRRDSRGRTWAIVPNGIESPDGKAALFAYQLDNWRIEESNIKKYERVADEDNTKKDNGLMAISVADTDGDGYFDVVYGGDLKGNIWRWDFTGEEPGEAVKIFQAKDAKGQPQAITGGISYARESGVNGRHFIGFGTGRYISISDMPQAGQTAANTQLQSVYGIIDETLNNPLSSSAKTNNPIISGRNVLQERKIVYNKSNTRSFGKYEALGKDKKGWYLDLPVQERVISSPSLFYGAMYFISAIPPLTGSDECGHSGSSYLNAIHLFSGTGSYNTNTGYFGGYASIDLNGEEVQVSSIKLEGMSSGLTLMQLPNGDTQVVTGNQTGDDGQEADPNSRCSPGACMTEAMKWQDNTQIKRIQWRSLL